MTASCKKCICIVLILLFSCHALAATYSYEGGLYQNINGPNYDTSMRVTASFETFEPLELNLARGDISAWLLNFSFNDGIQTITQDDAEILAFNISTNAQGVPDTWNITLWRSPVTNVMGDIVDGIDLVFNIDEENGNSFTEQGFSEPCESTGADYCTLVVLATNSGGLFEFGLGLAAPGNWRVSGLPTQAVPVSDLWVLMVLALLMLTVGMFYSNNSQ